MDRDKIAALINAREKAYKTISTKSFDTIATHGIYDLHEAMLNQGSIIEPVYMTTAQAFSSADELQKALAYEIPSWAYSRIHNPSVYYLESTLALLESYQTSQEASCCVMSSGMAAITAVADALLANAKNANFVACSQVYVGTFQQFSVRQLEKGREVRWVAASSALDIWQAAIDEQTRFIYIEIPSNPSLTICDIKSLANLAQSYDIPLIVDATLATPALLRPLQYGADIVIHSLSKIISASGMVIGGAVISRANMRGAYLLDEMREDFASYLKLLPNRDNGACLSAMSSLLTLSELRTLRMRVDQLSQTALTVANFLNDHKMVEKVIYPGLKNHPQHDLARSYFTLVDADKHVNRYGHLLSFLVKGDLEKTKSLLSRLQMIFRATDLGRIKSVATIPAISTHQQQGESGRDIADIPVNLIRLSVGGEHPQDIIDDLAQALS
ncbi:MULTISPECIES: trans-sulfuration enzyme family protein [Cysteiniphilum]|uniref:O-acetylhomoserine aminocarboxypropyltransferase n=1 Tax=Cysteiniphilum litorale TaxID=2056700 RepID=A0A8J2Z516_9GAMM|nr:MULTISPECIES: PLP-dependent aspartate aminotransferase family protein [Cysteiniphilum]GGF99757.1 O-acetylhomoserine aminocarboxypropyltransferase [Cysteiniphilum litorale]